MTRKFLVSFVSASPVFGFPTCLVTSNDGSLPSWDELVSARQQVATQFGLDTATITILAVSEIAPD